MTSKSKLWSAIFIFISGAILLLPDIVHAQTPISCGQTLAGSISTLGEQDSYTFAGSNGDVITIRTRKTSGNLTPFLELYSPGGGLLQSGTQISQSLGSTGTYTIKVRDLSNNNTGDYVVYWQSLKAPCNAVGAACGELVDGTVGTSVDPPPWRVHTMTVPVSQKVRFHLVNTSGYVAPLGELYNSSGALVTNFTIVDLTLAAGTYTILVRDYYNVNMGGYRLTWRPLLAPCSGSPAPISCGQATGGTIAGADEIDYYTFTASGGDRVTIRARKASGSVIPNVELYASDGTLLGGPLSQFDVTLTAGGTYTLLVRDNVYLNTGDYVVYWQSLKAPCNAVGISCGQLIKSSIGTTLNPPPWRVYTMTMSLSGLVSFHLVNTSGGVNPLGELYDSNGMLVTNFTIVDLTLAAGAYTILVRDYYNLSAGEFNLKYQKNNSCPEVIVTAPNGGEVIEGGPTFTITWIPTAPQGISSQEIKLSTDGGQSFPTVIVTGLPGDAQSFNWTVPTEITTGKARVRVTVMDTSGMSTPDDSDADFIIVQTVKRTYYYDQLNRLIQIIYED